jgi:hypothetical protein
LHDPILKKSITKDRDDGVPQVVECLLSKYEALSSNSIPPKWKRRILGDEFNQFLLSMSSSSLYFWLVASNF